MSAHTPSKSRSPAASQAESPSASSSSAASSSASATPKAPNAPNAPGHARAATMGEGTAASKTSASPYEDKPESPMATMFSGLFGPLFSPMPLTLPSASMWPALPALSGLPGFPGFPALPAIPGIFARSGAAAEGGAGEGFSRWAQQQINTQIALAQAALHGFQGGSAAHARLAEQTRDLLADVQTRCARTDDPQDLLQVQAQVMTLIPQTLGSLWQQWAGAMAQTQADVVAMLTDEMAQLNLWGWQQQHVHPGDGPALAHRRRVGAAAAASASPQSSAAEPEPLWANAVDWWAENWNRLLAVSAPERATDAPTEPVEAATLLWNEWQSVARQWSDLILHTPVEPAAPHAATSGEMVANSETSNGHSKPGRTQPVPVAAAQAARREPDRATASAPVRTPKRAELNAVGTNAVDTNAVDLKPADLKAVESAGSAQSIGAPQAKPGRGTTHPAQSKPARPSLSV